MPPAPEHDAQASPFPAAPQLAQHPVLDANKRALMRTMFGVELGPRRLGAYVVLGEIGAGAMGVVHVAYDERLDRKVAIKRLHAAHDEHLRRRWLREAQAMARVTHPNVVSVFEVVEGDGGELLIVMEFIDGQTLRAWQQRPRSRAQLLAAFVQAGRGLAAVHAAGLVHRDFKPDNAMIDGQGHVRVMDFGLAHAATQPPGASAEAPRPAPDPASRLELTSLTRSGALMGTPAYMSPEQLQGRATDSRSDQYNFCVALWEALAGQRPFDAEGIAELAAAVAAGKLREPPAGADFPPWLRRVLARGLAYEPGARWPTMDALLTALSQDPTRARRRRVGLAGALLLGLTSLGFAEHHASRPLAQALDAHTQRVHECGAPTAQLDEVWNEAVARRQGLAFVGERGASSVFARETWERTRAHLDEHARAWAKVAQQVCRAQPHPHTHARQSCLDGDLAAMRALLDILAVVEGEELLHASSAAAQLATPLRCLDVDPRMYARTGAGSLDSLREGLVRANLLRATANYLASAELAEELLEQALVHDAQALAAEAGLAHGRARFELGEYEVAEAALREAFAQAVAAGHDRVAVEASTTLVYLLGVGSGRSEEAARWSELGEMFILRAKLEGSVEQGRAMVVRAIGLGGWRGPAQGLAELERARELLERELGPWHPSLIDVYKYAAQRFGKHERAAAYAYYEHALDILHAALGPSHPHAARLLNQRGDLQLRDGELDAAERSFRRALEIQRGSVGLEHPDVVDTRALLGALARARGDLITAVEEQRQAVELAGRVSAPRVLVGHANRLAKLYALARRGAEGVVMLDELLRRTDLDAFGRLRLHEVRGELELARGDRDAARADFERAAHWASACTSVRERAHGFRPLVQLTEFALEERQHERASVELMRAAQLCRALASELEPGQGAPECQAVVEGLRGRLTGRSGRPG